MLRRPDAAGPPRTFYWHYPFNVIVKHPDNGFPLAPHPAIRVGDHKLIWDGHGRLESLPDSLKHPNDLTDLAATRPELT